MRRATYDTPAPRIVPPRGRHTYDNGEVVAFEFYDGSTPRRPGWAIVATDPATAPVWYVFKPDAGAPHKWALDHVAELDHKDAREVERRREIMRHWVKLRPSVSMVELNSAFIDVLEPERAGAPAGYAYDAAPLDRMDVERKRKPAPAIVAGVSINL